MLNIYTIVKKKTPVIVLPAINKQQKPRRVYKNRQLPIYRLPCAFLVWAFQFSHGSFAYVLVVFSTTQFLSTRYEIVATGRVEKPKAGDNFSTPDSPPSPWLSFRNYTFLFAGSLSGHKKKSNENKKEQWIRPEENKNKTLIQNTTYKMTTTRTTRNYKADETMNIEIQKI